MHKHGAITILRWGLAFVFFYAAVASLLRPQEWVGYVPAFLDNFPIKTVLTVFSLYELALATLLFISRKLYIASLASLITFGFIVLLNIGALDRVFENVGLAMASLALFELIEKDRSEKEDEI